MVQHEGDGFRIQPRVQRIEHGPRHGHAGKCASTMGGVLGSITTVVTHTPALCTLWPLAGARIGLAPVAGGAVDHGQPLGIDLAVRAMKPKGLSGAWLALLRSRCWS